MPQETTGAAAPPADTDLGPIVYPMKRRADANDDFARFQLEELEKHRTAEHIALEGPYGYHLTLAPEYKTGAKLVLLPASQHPFNQQLKGGTSVD